MATNVTVSHSIVRAWFDTVLNPLIRALNSEANLLAHRNFTWKTEVRRFATLVPVREHLVDEAQPNFDQFLSLHPEYNPPIAEHDRRLAPLAEACDRLQQALIEAETLRKVLDREKVQQSDMDFCVRLIAEYVINDAQTLPDYYTIAAIWNRHRDEFRAALQTNGVSPAWQATMEAAGTFETAVRELIDKLSAFRNELSLSSGVPIVDRLTG